MTEVSPKTVDSAMEDLDLSAAEMNQLEATLENDASREPSDHKVSKTVPLSASFRLAIYNALQPAIAKMAEEAAGRIHSHGESARRSVVEIGKELRAMKDKLGHGFFGKWIEAEFDMTAKTAQNYMNRARMAEKSESVPGLSDTALQLLAAPSADAVRDKIIKTIADDVRAGKPAPKTKAVKEMISKATAKPKAPPASTSATSATPAKAAPAGTSPVPAKPATPAPPSRPLSSSTTISTKSGPAAALAPSATSKPPMVVTALTKASPTRPATAEEIAGRRQGWSHTSNRN
ncbi:DUF3102 domain-containing protein [Mesorhizobium sp. WSM3860]|uniref:DUF3102 domain-containing protein n=1 Tax=Mesorhizobium sp. WSM3860 TaxID=2029403 RepID=UPI001596891F|nr:DUF3102 domain-containing protein [Mesorhizobium sp. WSM3860]